MLLQIPTANRQGSSEPLSVRSLIISSLGKNIQRDLLKPLSVWYSSFLGGLSASAHQETSDLSVCCLFQSSVLFYVSVTDCFCRETYKRRDSLQASVFQSTTLHKIVFAQSQTASSNVTF